MRNSDENLCFLGRKDILFKDNVEGIINKEIYLDHVVEVDVMEHPLHCVNRDDVLQEINEM